MSLSEKSTESESRYNHLETMAVHDLLLNINREDKTVSRIVYKSIPQIEKVIEAIVLKLKKGGRLFYIGSGTSGRLGVLDASECPPTYGVKNDLVVGIIAGGDSALRNAVEFAEDDFDAGWIDLKQFNISSKDFVVGISASGSTPYVIGALQNCSKNRIETACITCNKNTPLSHEAKYAIEIVVGPEFVTGSTRMKAGTAQKLVLNMISTAVMIRLGKVKGNKMIDLQLNNEKLFKRAVSIISCELNISENQSEKLLKKYHSVRKAIDFYSKTKK